MWISVHQNKNKFKAEILKNELLKKGIESVIMDKIDQSYPVIGFAEIMVMEENKELAERIINDFIFND